MEVLDLTCILFNKVVPKNTPEKLKLSVYNKVVSELTRDLLWILGGRFNDYDEYMLYKKSESEQYDSIKKEQNNLMLKYPTAGYEQAICLYDDIICIDKQFFDFVQSRQQSFYTRMFVHNYNDKVSKGVIKLTPIERHQDSLNEEKNNNESSRY